MGLQETTKMDNVNVTKVKAIYEAFGRGDVPSILGELAADVSWEFEGPSQIPYTGLRHGVEQVVGFFEGIADSEQNQKLVMNQYIVDGNSVVSVGRYSAAVKATGKFFTTPVAHVWEFRDGKVTRWSNYVSTAAWLAACS